MRVVLSEDMVTARSSILTYAKPSQQHIVRESDFSDVQESWLSRVGFAICLTRGSCEADEPPRG